MVLFVVIWIEPEVNIMSHDRKFKMAENVGGFSKL